MKHILLAFICLLSSFMWGQQSEYQKACAKYKTVQTVTAKCQRVRHKKLVAKDEVLQGSFNMSRPDKVNITMDGGKEALDMNGTQFTMTMKGKPHKTSSKTNVQFRTFQAVWESILAGGTDLSKTSDLEMKKEDGDILITITPKADAKTAKRMMFTSFLLVIDGKNGEIKSLRMNERGDNYTLYTFSDYQWK
ncbi:MAG: outer membrane lipoprotein carrier protein LolA [Bacteroidaceae bacterium]|nr:outer membrane lipoprotein carrier protein LolA [Bacteroidaceae bacterium]